jgi:quinolinate synthase
VDDDLDAGDLAAGQLDRLNAEPAVHRAVPAPEDHPRGLELFGGHAAAGSVRVEDHAVVQAQPEVALRWALDAARPGGDRKVLFLPDQHLGRNTAVLKLGLSLDDCVVYDPRKPGGGLTPDQLRAATMILWKGHCSVHGRFTRQCVDDVRERVPGVTVLVHPECTHEVVTAADLVGSTEFIIKTIEAAPAGSAWAIGTELNLVSRLAKAHPDKTIVFLDKTVCFCSTMNRIDLPHLVWTLESLVEGRVVNQISVVARSAKHARAALDQMLALPGA